MFKTTRLVLCFVSLAACKTTSPKDNDLASAEGSADLESAKPDLVKTLVQCAPIISAAVPGGITISLDDSAEKLEVVKKFVDAIVKPETQQSESVAFLAKLYEQDGGLTSVPCTGRVASYLVPEFAIHTNVIDIIMGAKASLKIVNLENRKDQNRN